MGGLAEKSENYQINSLLYVMWKKRDNVPITLKLDDDQRKKYTDVCNAQGEHFYQQTQCHTW